MSPLKAWHTRPHQSPSHRKEVLDVDIYEVRLNEEFLMSSLFTVSEIELSHLGLAAHD